MKLKRILSLGLSLALVGTLLPIASIDAEAAAPAGTNTLEFLYSADSTAVADGTYGNFTAYYDNTGASKDLKSDAGGTKATNYTKLTTVVDTTTKASYVEATAIAPEGYTFKKWNVEASKGTIDFLENSDKTITGKDLPEADYDATSNPVIVACKDDGTDFVGTVEPVFTANTYNVVFDPNLDSKILSDKSQFYGTMENQEMTYDVEAELNANAYTYLYHSLKEWNTKADGTGTAYADGAKVSKLTTGNTITLYAQWNDYTTTGSDDSKNSTSAIVSKGTDDNGNAMTTVITGTTGYQMIEKTANTTEVRVYDLKKGTSTSTSSSSSTTYNTAEGYVEDSENVTAEFTYEVNTNSTSSTKTGGLTKVNKFGDKTLEIADIVKVPSLTLNSTDGTIKVTYTEYNITSIGEEAADGLADVTKVKVANNVKTIGKRAFAEMDDLKTVNVSKKVTTIGAGAFRDCEKLNKATIKSKVKKIKKAAFAGDTKLATINIKANKLTKGNIGNNAFSGTKNKKTIKLTGGITKKKFKTLKKRLKKVGCKKATIKRGS